MTSRTRLFLIAAVSVLVLGLGTGLLASYVGLQNLVIIGSDGPDELAWIPADAGVVAFANVREVMDSELHRTVLDMQDGTREERRHEFEERTGIDVERDVDVVVASVGPGGGADGEAAIVVARGRFDEVRVEGLMRMHGAEVEEYKGERLLVIADDRASLGLAFVEPGVVTFGTPAAVRRAIDARAGGDAINANEEVMRLIRDVDDGNAWAVGRFDAISGARLPDGVATRLPPIAWFAASGRIDSGVRGMIRAEAQSEQAATDLRDVVRGFVALARLRMQQNPDLSDAMNTLELGGEGTTVSLAFSVPPGVISELASMHRRRLLEPPDPPGSPVF